MNKCAMHANNKIHGNHESSKGRLIDDDKMSSVGDEGWTLCSRVDRLDIDRTVLFLGSRTVNGTVDC